MRSLLFSTVALLALACGPLVMIPGGELAGDVKPLPSDWSFTDAHENVQLETRPADPYSVNVWAVAANGAIYVASGRGEDAAWARHIADDPRVRLRVGDALYELSAVRTEDEAERESFLVAAKAKYDFEPDPEETSTAILFRLDPR